MLSETPPSYPSEAPCAMCLKDGKFDAKTHGAMECPGWEAVPENLADAKALLARCDLSLDAAP